jgi:hypothetical protein
MRRERLGGRAARDTSVRSRPGAAVRMPEKSFSIADVRHAGFHFIFLLPECGLSYRWNLGRPFECLLLLL